VDGNKEHVELAQVARQDLLRVSAHIRDRRMLMEVVEAPLVCEVVSAVQIAVVAIQSVPWRRGDSVRGRWGCCSCAG
jgi:hypothetical protein